jgi:CRP-like cAMP-binding protein
MLQKRPDGPRPEPRDSTFVSNIANHILNSLPHATLKRILPDLELINTVSGQIIDQVDRPIEYLYFINRGLVSLVKTMQDGRTVEVGAVGIEGITDPSALFGIDQAIVGSIIQIPGTAMRIRRDILSREMEKDDALLDAMHKCVRFATSQLMQTAACNRLHCLEERCCFWLLIAHDSALAKSFPLTQEFLAMMLGVQRPGVSIAACSLQKAGLIQYRRGRVTITDQSGLKDASCECYGAMQAELKRLFGTPKRR